MKKITTYYEEENNFIEIFELNDKTLKINLALSSYNTISFEWTYIIKIIDNNIIFECVKEPQNYIKDTIFDIGWSCFRCELLELHFNNVALLITNNFNKEEWLQILIYIFPNIPYYNIDEEPENNGIIWLNNIIKNIKEWQFLTVK
jgi:hypothetical protein